MALPFVALWQSGANRMTACIRPARSHGDIGRAWIAKLVFAIALSLLGVEAAVAQPGPVKDDSNAVVGSSLQGERLTRQLAVGPNGPIPAIVVDQFGYPTTARKIAVVRNPQSGYDSAAKFSPGPRYALVDADTSEIAFAGPITPWNSGATDQASGDKAWWFDFSSVSRPGKYTVVDLQRRVASADFRIGDDVYAAVMKAALKAVYLQRAGHRKLPEHVGAAWADAASHMGAGQDPQSQPWPGARSLMSGAGARDLRGGWFDAGDYNKYTTWTARYVIVLLRAFEESPRAFGDDLGIAESGNGIPDVLDEVKWGLDWLIRMQGTDGGVLCVQSVASGSPPSAARGPSHYGPPTTSATLMTAAAFAYASKIYGKLPQEQMRTFGTGLAERARSAWSWARTNPNVLYWNNDDARQPGSKGLAHGQQELNDTDRMLAWSEAAMHVFEITGDTNAKSVAEANIDNLVPSYGASLWEVDRQDAALYFTTIPGLSFVAQAKVRAAFLAHATPAVERFASSLMVTDAYRAPISQYTWASSKAKAMQARLFQLAALYAGNDGLRSAALEAARGYVHYIHGVNPLGLVYLSNMGSLGASHSANTIFHSWFAKGTKWEQVAPGKPGPAPGFVVGGPNPSFSLDGCCSQPNPSGAPRCYSPAAARLCDRNYRPPLGQPPAKSYLQFNEVWPANSWAVTEPSLSYQTYFIRMLAPFVR